MPTRYCPWARQKRICPARSHNRGSCRSSSEPRPTYRPVTSSCAIGRPWKLRLPLSKSAKTCGQSSRVRSVRAPRGLDLVKPLPGVEEDSLAGPDDRVRRVKDLVLRDAIDWKISANRNVRHPRMPDPERSRRSGRRRNARTMPLEVWQSMMDTAVNSSTSGSWRRNCSGVAGGDQSADLSGSGIRRMSYMPVRRWSFKSIASRRTRSLRAYSIIRPASESSSTPGRGFTRSSRRVPEQIGREKMTARFCWLDKAIFSFSWGGRSAQLEGYWPIGRSRAPLRTTTRSRLWLRAGQILFCRAQGNIWSAFPNRRNARRSGRAGANAANDYGHGITAPGWSADADCESNADFTIIGQNRIVVYGVANKEVIIERI